MEEKIASFILQECRIIKKNSAIKKDHGNDAVYGCNMGRLFMLQEMAEEFSESEDLLYLKKRIDEATQAVRRAWLDAK